MQNQPIGILGDKNTESVSFIFAILESGNGYLPINPEWPSERIEFIFSASNLHACIIENKYLGTANSVLTNAGISYEEMSINGDYTFIRTSLAPRNYPKNLSYILFTSGSTGFPKGIVHCSDGIVAFLKWCGKEFSQYKINKFISIAPLNFDLSVFDLFFPLISVKTLFLPAHATISNTRLFSQYLVANKIESVYTTPSYLKLLMQTGQLNRYDLKFVKLILIAGEPLTYNLVLELKKYFKKASFYNLYGPTETNVCTYHKIEFSKIKRNDVVVPIGKSCYSSTVMLNKKSELIYKGKLLMKSFINENGVNIIKDGSSFNTGDKVIKLKNGNLEFSGRCDNMIKRNGFRIELNEIKYALLKFTGITNCEVLVTDNPQIQIRAFVESPEKPSELQMRTYLLSKLPSYMLPDMIIVMEKFPMNSNHKTDLRKLQENYL